MFRDNIVAPNTSRQVPMCVCLTIIWYCSISVYISLFHNNNKRLKWNVSTCILMGKIVVPGLNLIWLVALIISRSISAKVNLRYWGNWAWGMPLAWLEFIVIFFLNVCVLLNRHGSHNSYWVLSIVWLRILIWFLIAIWGCHVGTHLCHFDSFFFCQKINISNLKSAMVLCPFNPIF